MHSFDDELDKLQLATELFDSFRQDQAVGIMDARMAWEQLDDEVLIITAGWAGSAEQELVTPDTTALFGATGYDWAFFVEAQNTLAFHQLLEVLVDHAGQPPASAAMRHHALDILRGRIHLSGAIRLVSVDAELRQWVPDIYQTFLPGVDPRHYPILNQAVRVAAALALPRDELYRLRGVDPGDRTTRVTPLNTKHLSEIRDQYQQLMAEAEATQAEDRGREEELLVQALDLAMQSPEPDDDLEVIQRLLELAQHFPVSHEAIQRCASALDLLVDRGHTSEAVARCLIELGNVSNRQRLIEDVGQTIITAGSHLLEAQHGEATQLLLKTTVAKAWLGLGRTDRARPLLKEVDDATLSPKERLSVALMSAEAFDDQHERGRATNALTDALRKAPKASPMYRLPVLQKLIAVWPESMDLDGLIPYVDELLEIARGMKEPRRTLCLVNTALRLWPSGRRVQALRAWSMIDEDQLRREAPPMMASKVLQVVEKARQQLDSSQSKTVVK